MSSDEVEKRYDELQTLVAGMNQRGDAAPEASALMGSLLTREARLLDLARYDAWLDGWADDGVLWVPLDPSASPGRDQSLFLDDRRRLTDRVAWRGEESAWGQQPPSVTVRSITGVEAWVDGTTIVARSTLLLNETRRGHEQMLAGHQIHEYTDDHKIRSKVILLPQLTIGVRNPSFVL